MSFLQKVRRKLRNQVKAFQDEQQFRKNLKLVRRAGEESAAARKMIIDCGFNKGEVAERLLRKLDGFSLVGFEVQQDIQHFAERVKGRFPGRDVEVIYKAVSTADGSIEYYEAQDWGKNYRGGTTTVSNKVSMDVCYADAKSSPAIDFSRWVMDNVPEDAFVFVKMDIEGAEYDVIERLLESGAADRIDILAVEWHAHKFPEPQRSRYLAIEKRIKEYANSARVTVLDWY
jgi:FkbM family methyltransferase